MKSQWPSQGRELRWCELHDRPVASDKDICSNTMNFCRIGPVPANIRDAIAEQALKEVADLWKAYTTKTGKERLEARRALDQRLYHDRRK